MIKTLIEIFKQNLQKKMLLFEKLRPKIRNLKLLLLFAFAIASAFTFLHSLKIGFIEGINEDYTSLKFKLRGHRFVDSLITFIYVDDDMIQALGGLPLKRNYFAFLIDALSNLGAKAIGIDIVFAEKNFDYPERDNLLVYVTEKSGRVCLAGFFSEVSEGDELPKGKKFIKPFDELRNACAGFGHLNFRENSYAGEIPLFIKDENGNIVPSFSLELVRLFLGIPKDSVEIDGDVVTLKSSTGKIQIPMSGGFMRINYDGGIESVKMFSAIEFAKIYEEFVTGTLPESLALNFKDKIVVIGIVSEGAGQFVKTPFETKFPASGLHIMSMSTILKENFLKDISLSFHFTILFLFSSFSLYVVVRFHSILKAIVAGFAILVSFFLFDFLMFNLGIISPISIFLGIALSAFSGVAYVFEVQRRHFLSIEREKQKIEMMLEEKERRISELQKEIEQARVTFSERSELEKFYDEVRDLTFKIDDLSEYLDVRKELYDEFEGIVYAQGGKMEKVVELIKKVAPSDVPVLITGESGTGKELVARAIHKLSPRGAKKFLPINCGAIPETLLESELFGYERGAFTGAVQRKQGLFEVADGGTIFLDEITETSESFQAKLLRTLQFGEFTRVGGVETVKVDVRVIAATNRDIEEEVRNGRFREDLYYRLNVIRIHLPPLRERKGDIPYLVNYLLERFKAGDMKISNSVMEVFLAYDWPGNIRQLENALNYALILAKSDGRKLIQMKDLPEDFINSVRGKVDIERRIISLLREKSFSHSSISETALELGMNRGTISEYLRGVCFRELYESGFDVELASRRIAGDRADPETIERVRRKINEYLSNFIENIGAKPPEDLKAFIKAKYKNLPARYHFYLEETARKFLKKT